MACPETGGDDIDAAEAFMKPVGSSVYDAYEAFFVSVLDRVPGGARSGGTRVGGKP